MKATQENAGLGDLTGLTYSGTARPNRHYFSPPAGLRMTFWQENYAFIKDVYDMRHQKMAEWMENVEKVSKLHRLDRVPEPAKCLPYRELANCHRVKFLKHQTEHGYGYCKVVFRRQEFKINECSGFFLHPEKLPIRLGLKT